MKTLTIAHRGAQQIAPENTLTAFKLALKKGFMAVECDVQLTHDGELVIIHDATVDRTTDGKGLVSTIDLSKIQSLRIKDRERIPTLREVFELVVVKANKKIIIEIKGDTLPAAIETAKSLAGYLNSMSKKYQKNVEVHSFWYEALKEFKSLSPEIVTAAILSGGFSAKQILDIARGSDANGVSLNYSYVSSEIVKQCHANGIFIDTYDVSDGTVMKRLRRFGLNAVIENFTGKVI
jgi:glycerophosphoryl diester phosphodiesterase